eukprot:1940740-Rhodomonas_salina.2
MAILRSSSLSIHCRSVTQTGSRRSNLLHGTFLVPRVRILSTGAGATRWDTQYWRAGTTRWLRSTVVGTPYSCWCTVLVSCWYTRSPTQYRFWNKPVQHDPYSR